MQCSACGPLQYGVNCQSILLVMNLIERGNLRLLYKYYSYKDTFIEQTSNTIVEHEGCRVGHFEQTDKPDQTSPYPPQESRKLSICLVCKVTNPHGTSAFLAMPTVPGIHCRHRRRISSLSRPGHSKSRGWQKLVLMCSFYVIQSCPVVVDKTRDNWKEKR